MIQSNGKSGCRGVTAIDSLVSGKGFENVLAPMAKEFTYKINVKATAWKLSSAIQVREIIKLEFSLINTENQEF
jgi:hypothetical protein